MKKLFVLLTTVILFNTLQAQSFDSLLQRYGSMIPQEKAWLHFDKSAYLPGETVWFKAYGWTHCPGKTGIIRGGQPVGHEPGFRLLEKF